MMPQRDAQLKIHMLDVVRLFSAEYGQIGRATGIGISDHSLDDAAEGFGKSLHGLATLTVKNSVGMIS